jgi:hypothetical protein
VFPPDYDDEAPKERAILEALVLRRCVLLWDMVRRGDQARLARHIKRSDDPRLGPVFTYDSHPDLPAGQKAPPPDVRERSPIEGVDAGPKPTATAKSEDLRPAARAYLAGVINKKLEGGLDVRVSERPGSPGPMKMHLVPRTLLAGLWLQFANEVTGKFTPSECPVCKEWFRPVKHHDRVYCSNNGKCKVQAHRIRKRAELLLAQGMSPKQVAEQENLDESVLRRLLDSRRKEKKPNGKKTKGKG